MNGQERLAQQSKAWLITALFDLLVEQPYETITVKQIAEQAQLSRRTFYRAFRDKDDLLDAYNHEVGQRYLNALQQIAPQKMVFKDVLTYFFEFWWQERKQLRLLMEQGLFGRMLAKITPMANEIYRVFPAPWHIAGSPTETAYIMSFAVGGFWNVLSQWLVKDQPESPAEMATLLMAGLQRLGETSD
ncbi:TetR/AcrR family transcriptional regulator [Levilactobacillus lanxiensis]|uniref:TetR/AcrR family transcriptional regulator n=1 Tax=Levilactobacillus lanxiensis TaxID=2799568 RepID=A0ABW4D7Z6_9LACO|nr:TetR/AcrR family transcriptional regulator [Levilactobacillus lanxiensis]